MRLLVIFALLPLFLCAQQTYKLDDLGLSLELPKDWQASLEEDYLYLEHSASQSAMLVLGDKFSGVSAIQTTLGQYQELAGLQLSPSGQSKTLQSDQVSQSYTGYYQGYPISSKAIGLYNNKGYSLVFVLVAPDANALSANDSTLKQLVNSVQFFKAKPSALTLKWQEALVGNRLENRYTSNGAAASGTTTQTYVELCSDGSFFYYHNAHISGFNSAGSVYANSNKEGSGNYEIYCIDAACILKLNFDDGETDEYDLSLNEEENFFLDKSRYYILELTRCN